MGRGGPIKLQMMGKIPENLISRVGGGGAFIWHLRVLIRMSLRNYCHLGVIAATSKLSSEAVEVRKQTVNWMSYVQ